MRIAVSAGHSSIVRGAVGPEPWGLDEFDENVVMVNKITIALNRIAGVEAEQFIDTISNNQDENLNRIVSWHNHTAFNGIGGDDRLDVSIHFNSTDPSPSYNPIGTEVWYYSGNDRTAELADAVSTAIARASGLIDRGNKPTTGLYVINNTEAPCILIEVAFVMAKPDCDLYRAHKDDIAVAIAEEIGGTELEDRPPWRPERPPPGEIPEEVLFYARGTCSWFGGPEDDGVSSSEGLAFIYPDDFDEFRHLFLPEQPAGTTGMARRLDSDRVFYIACRWDYDSTPKDMLRDQTFKALVRANGREFCAYPADWGPHEEQTGRAADLSLALMRALFDSDDATDEMVEVFYQAPDL